MAATSSRRNRAAGRLIAVRKGDAAVAADRPGPDTPAPGGAGPASFLAPTRITADTTPVATAADGEWVYPGDTPARAA